MEDKIVYVNIDNWCDMGDADTFLNEFLEGKHEDEINYSEVWYDMAIVFCITTTQKYAEEHNITNRIVDDIKGTLFEKYYPKYNPNSFGSAYIGEYQGWAPYKQFDAELREAIKKKGLIKNE